MTDSLATIATAILLVCGSLFALTAATGLVRLPDVYTRMHAASKAGTVGSGLLLLAAGIDAGEPAVLARALAGFVFFLLTVPISAHLLARAAHRTGYPLWDASVRDELRRDGD